MLIKSADDRAEDIAELNALLAEAKLTSLQKKHIQEKLDNLEKGAWGEQEAAYFIDFHFAASENHIILHDLRLILTDGRTAQIDHLLINRSQDFYVLETKNWQQLTVDETGACTIWAGRIIGVESPLEQCRRHADILTIALQATPQLKALVPRYQIIPRVLVAPSCHLKAPHHQEWYVKADAFYSVRAKEIENISTIKTLMEIPRFISKETLVKLGQALAGLHNPDRIDWRTRLGLSLSPVQKAIPANKVVSSIEGLADYVPRWGEDWFILKAKPTEETKKAIKAAGYSATKENGEWMWKLRS